MTKARTSQLMKQNATIKPSRLYFMLVCLEYISLIWKDFHTSSCFIYITAQLQWLITNLLFSKVPQFVICLRLFKGDGRAKQGKVCFNSRRDSCQLNSDASSDLLWYDTCQNTYMLLVFWLKKLSKINSFLQKIFNLKNILLTYLVSQKNKFVTK